MAAAVEEGYRESEASWFELLNGLVARGLTNCPKLATADGALGFWKALSKVYPQTKQQRCWVHKTANVLNKLPKAVQPKVKEACMISGWLRRVKTPTKLLIRRSPSLPPSIHERWTV